MKIESLNKLLEDQRKDLFSAENQLAKALPKMAKPASARGLMNVFTSHLEETRGQVQRLQEVGELLEVKLAGKKCKAMEGLIEEGKEVLEADGPRRPPSAPRPARAAVASGTVCGQSVALALLGNVLRQADCERVDGPWP